MIPSTELNEEQPESADRHSHIYCGLRLVQAGWIRLFFYFFCMDGSAIDLILFNLLAQTCFFKVIRVVLKATFFYFLFYVSLSALSFYLYSYCFLPILINNINNHFIFYVFILFRVLGIIRQIKIQSWLLFLF